MSGHRLLVVGASSGIGRAVVTAALQAGDQVAAAARRVALLEDTGAVPLQCDVTDAAACSQVVADAVAALGGLDRLVYAAGCSSLAAVDETDATAWWQLLATNVVGAALVTSAALPSLSAAHGAVVFLGSHSVPHPWPGLVAYASSKAALDTLATGWRREVPTVRFTCLAVGPTATAFASDWDPQRAADYFARWQSDGDLTTDVAMPEAIASQVLAALDAP